ncbi:MAG: DUF4112 domain-containing protein [Bacteroidaceae bacterium]|nr:DUF4112 domain-containing protein [Bacteroidaceae bacterium]
MSLWSYRFMERVARYMDKYYLDPIIGFFMPAGLGDFLTGVLSVPFVYYSLCVVRSVPLTLAVVCNMLIDMVLGMIPFAVGDIIDIFHKSYNKNLHLIVGYVNDDRRVISQVRKKSFWFVVVIILLCVIMYFQVIFLIWLAKKWMNFVG